MRGLWSDKLVHAERRALYWGILFGLVWFRCGLFGRAIFAPTVEYVVEFINETKDWNLACVRVELEHGQYLKPFRLIKAQEQDDECRLPLFDLCEGAVS